MYWWILANSACHDSGRTPASNHDGETDLAETGGTTGTTSDTGSPASATVVSAEGLPGSFGAQFAVRVRTDRPAPVAVRCAQPDSLTEIHLVEDPAATETHELHFVGVRPDTDYVCRAIVTDPPAPSTVSLTWHTATPDVQLPDLGMELTKGATPTGAYLLAPMRWGDWTWLVIWGPNGSPRWWWRLPHSMNVAVEALLDRGTTRILVGGGRSRRGAPTLVDLWDGPAWVAPLPEWGSGIYHHDSKRLEDGRLITLEQTTNHWEDLQFQGFAIRVYDPATDTVDVQLNSQTLVDDGDLPPRSYWDDDPYHANWLDLKETPDGPVVYVSLHHLHRILALDPATGHQLWALGAGLGWTVVDGAGRSLGQLDLPQGQHGLEVSGDELLVYDNGVGRHESRAERWRIDPLAMKATRLWSWTEDDWYQSCLGDIDDLGNGHVFLTQASTGTDGHTTRFKEVDTATDEVVARWWLPPATAGYRGERYDGCDLFSITSICPALGARDAELAPYFGD